MVRTNVVAPKISVKIWRPILDKLDVKLEAACLRRDAYLSKVLANEIKCLDDEVVIPNSQAGYDYLTANLDLLDRKLVSFALPSELSSRIAQVCDSKRIPRDAWFNRVLLLLVAGPKTIDKLLFWHYDGDWRIDVWARFRDDTETFREAFERMEVHVSPFAWIREGLGIYTEKVQLKDYLEPSSGATVKVTHTLTGQPELPVGLYTTLFEKREQQEINLVGLNTYMPDWKIPGHSAAVAEGSALDKLFGEI